MIVNNLIPVANVDSSSDDDRDRQDESRAEQARQLRGKQWKWQLQQHRVAPGSHDARAIRDLVLDVLAHDELPAPDTDTLPQAEDRDATSLPQPRVAPRKLPSTSDDPSTAHADACEALPETRDSWDEGQRLDDERHHPLPPPPAPTPRQERAAAYAPSAATPAFGQGWHDEAAQEAPSAPSDHECLDGDVHARLAATRSSAFEQGWHDEAAQEAPSSPSDYEYLDGDVHARLAATRSSPSSTSGHREVDATRLPSPPPAQHPRQAETSVDVGATKPPPAVASRTEEHDTEDRIEGGPGLQERVTASLRDSDAAFLPTAPPVAQQDAHAVPARESSAMDARDSESTAEPMPQSALPAEVASALAHLQHLADALVNTGVARPFPTGANGADEPGIEDRIEGGLRFLEGYCLDASTDSSAVAQVPATVLESQIGQLRMQLQGLMSPPPLLATMRPAGDIKPAGAGARGEAIASGSERPARGNLSRQQAQRVPDAGSPGDTEATMNTLPLIVVRSV